MTERRRLILIAAALILGTLAAGLSRAQHPHRLAWREPGNPDYVEFEAQQYKGAPWVPVYVIGPSIPCLDCNEGLLDAPWETGCRRHRSVWGGERSDWSVPICLPEPGFALGLMVGVVGMAISRRTNDRLRTASDSENRPTPAR